MTSKEYLDAIPPRRDWTRATPPFRITDRERGIFAAIHESHWPQVLADLHQQHCWKYRPLIGLSGSLDGMGFRHDWERNRAQHMAEASAEFQRVFGRTAA